MIMLTMLRVVIRRPARLIGFFSALLAIIAPITNIAFQLTLKGSKSGPRIVQPFTH